MIPIKFYDTQSRSLADSAAASSPIAVNESSTHFPSKSFSSKWIRRSTSRLRQGDDSRSRSQYNLTFDAVFVGLFAAEWIGCVFYGWQMMSLRRLLPMKSVVVMVMMLRSGLALENIHCRLVKWSSRTLAWNFL